jgi:hypothetical protein
MQIIKLIKSPRKNKRFRVYLDNNEYYDFGLDTGSTYIDHHDKILRENYRKRHLGNDIERHLIENFIESPSLFSYYLLWGDSTDLKKNIENLNKKLL